MKTDMKKYWYKMIKETQDKINNTEAGKDGRLRQLGGQKVLFEYAFAKCMRNDSTPGEESAESR